MSEVKSTKPAKKGFNWVFVLVPVAVIAACMLAFALPPSHALIVNGPLKPLFARIGLAPPAKSLASKEKASDPAAEIKRLGDELAADRKTEIEKDARIAQLQSEVSGLQAPVNAQSSPAPAPKPSPTGVPEAVKRAASYWAGMDAEKAADIAQRLPEPYVKVVFSQMAPDAVAEIMNAMPAKIAAKLTADAEPNAP